MRPKYFLLWFVLLLAGGESLAQHYAAAKGSNYAGSLGAHDNPSSLLSSPYKWDITLLGTQYQTISNAVRGPNFPFYFSPDASFQTARGNYARRADVNYDVRLLNFRYAINERHAIAGGLNLRGYFQAASSRVNYNDSVLGPRSFLLMNEANRVLQANVTSSAWMEFYGSYALTVFDREIGRLNAGVSLKLLRSMSGAFARVREIGVRRHEVDDRQLYRIADGSARYGYSANHGDWSSFEMSDLMQNNRPGAAIDIGVEYLIKTQAVPSVYDIVEPNEYDWKIGISLLDLGWNNFTYSAESRSAASLKDEVSSLALQEKFSAVRSVVSFNDSLATIVDHFEPLEGNFRVFNPARVVLNVDRHLSRDFYLNGELSVNLVSGDKARPAVTETRLLTVTPRWETSRLGLYAPVQYTRRGNFWIGGAVRAGPLILGVHNLLNMFSKKQYLGGGAYLAFVLRPSEFMKDPRHRQYDCPPY